MKPLIRLFKLSNVDCYFFDTNRNEIVSVNPKFYSYLEKYMSNESLETDDECSAYFNYLHSKGYLSENRFKVIQHPMTDFLPNILENKIEAISFQMTQNCNLRCSYCPYTGNYYTNRLHNSKRMDFSLITKGLDFLADHSSDCERVNISFYGGEPLLEADLVAQSIRYSESVFQGKTIVFAITTNGTIMNEDIMNMLSTKKIRLLVSLDGPEQVHNANRVYVNGKGSFHDVIKNMQMLKKKYPEYYKEFVMINTVMASDIDMMSIDRFYTEDEFFSDTHVQTTVTNPVYRKDEVTTTDNDQTTDPVEYEFNKYVFFLYKLGRIKESKSRIFANYFSDIIKAEECLKAANKLPDIFHPSGPCIPGRKKLFMDVNGVFYPCERINETSPVGVIGDVNHGIDVEKCNELLNIGTITEKQCKNCWAIGHCKICFIQSDDGEKLNSSDRLNRCPEIRQTVLEEFKDVSFFKKHHYDFMNTDL